MPASSVKGLVASMSAMIDVALVVDLEKEVEADRYD